MRTKTVDAGRITGLSSYEAAVITGKFTGTYEEFLDKEMKTYNDMKEYADNAKCIMDDKIASLSDDNVNLAEVVEARAEFKTLGERLNNFDSLIDTIINRMSGELNDDEVIDNAYVDEAGNLTLMVGTKDGERGTGNCKGSSTMIEIRRHGAYIQWRYKGYSQWIELFSLNDIVPKFRIGKCEFVDNEEEAGASIGGSLLNPTLDLRIPRGKAGLNGGDILNARVNEKGELILTVTDIGEGE